VLTEFLLVLSLAQDSGPAPFHWMIEGLGEPQPTISVTVTPTPFGLVSGVEIKAIALDPLPTHEDPNPRLIQPTSSEATSKWGLRATFAKPGRRFHLRVTLSDGSIHKIDIYRKAPPEEPKIYQIGPLQLIGPRGTWATSTQHPSREPGDFRAG
jgi:hypothetical protein